MWVLTVCFAVLKGSRERLIQSVKSLNLYCSYNSPIEAISIDFQRRNQSGWKRCKCVAKPWALSERLYSLRASVCQCWLNAVVFVVCSSRTDLSGHVTDGNTQFLPSVNPYWLLALSVIWLSKMWNANLPTECQMHNLYANYCAIFCKKRLQKNPFDCWTYALYMTYIERFVFTKSNEGVQHILRFTSENVRVSGCTDWFK